MSWLHLPFEQAFNLILDEIDRTKAALTTLETFQATLRAPATTPEAYYHNYERDRRGRGGYQWRKVTIEWEQMPLYNGGGGTYNKFFAVLPSSRRHGETERKELGGYRYADNLALTTELNTQYAKWLDHEADSLRRYIAWQTRRVETWTEQPLLPVATKNDKAGFVPTKPIY